MHQNCLLAHPCRSRMGYVNKLNGIEGKIVHGSRAQYQLNGNFLPCTGFLSRVNFLIIRLD